MDHIVPEPPCKKMSAGGGARECAGGGTRLEDLPREIILGILSRLPITSLVQFRHVCRSWRSLAQDPLLVDMHLSLTAKRNPFLVFHCDYPLRNQLGFVELSAATAGSPPQDDGRRVRKFPLPFQDSMPEFDVVGSSNGLLCLSDSLYKELLYVYNPFTGEFRKLPGSGKYPDQDAIFGFGYSPATGEYKVIKVVYYPNSSRTSSSHRPRRLLNMQSEVQALTLGGPCPSWRSLGRVPYQIGKKQPETLINGRLHWVTRRYRMAWQIVSFDLADEQFREVPRPEGVGALARGNYQLSVLAGCLSAVVYRSYGRLEIWAMKTYDVRESWVKEFSIGAYMPKGLKQSPNPTIMKIWKNLNRRVARVLCVLDNGEVLLEYKSRSLAAFDPKRGKFRDIVLQGTPNWFHAFAHVGSLCWTDTLIAA